MEELIKTAIIGSGGMARHHIRQMLVQQKTTQITAICEPSKEMYAQASCAFQESRTEAAAKRTRPGEIAPRLPT